MGMRLHSVTLGPPPTAPVMMVMRTFIVKTTMQVLALTTLMTHSSKEKDRSRETDTERQADVKTRIERQAETEKKEEGEGVGRAL